MTASANIANLKAAYKAWHDCRGASADCWLDIMADEVRYSGMGEDRPGLEFSGNRLSKQEMVDYFAALDKNWTMDHWKPETFLGDGDMVAMFGTCAFTNRSTGKSAEIRIGHLFKFKDGKCVDITEVFDSARFAAAAAATP